ncbi:MAG TPA: V-type ATP synthase subunit D, partial [Rhabdochlamydiaceae bacterium]|nr:V-type ATP synthase subunit D [Rhabdochlamydiaceae bacterium]
MVKLTKTELRSEQYRFQQLNKYLPTLQLKKMLLQIEVNQAELEIHELQGEFGQMEKKITAYAALFSDKSAFDLYPAVKVVEVQKKHENIAGIDIPVLEKVVFQESSYMLFEAPVWLDSAIVDLRELITIREKIRVGEEKKAALEKEL